MSNRFQDEVGAPAPPNKRKRVAISLIIGVVALAALVIGIRAGKSTKDPVRPVQSASESARQDLSDEAGKSLQTKAGTLLDSDGGVSQVGAEAKREIEQKTARKMAEAEQQAIDKERREREDRQAALRKQQGLPSSMDANGHPVDPELEEAGQGTNPDGTKKIPLPGYAKGWDPGREIFVEPGGGRPAYRYQPAYLTGSNSVQTQEDMKQLDAKWLNSMGKPSIGASQAADEQLNRSFKGLKDYQVIQDGHYGTRVIRVEKDYQADTTSTRTDVPCETAPPPTTTREIGPLVVPSSRHAARVKWRKKKGGTR